jgi:phosphoribosylamine---glycine ligase
METIGVLLVSYGAREVAMADTLLRSTKYDVKLYVADKQCNPFNVEHATKHKVIPNLDIDEITKFAQENKDQLDFVLVGSETPIINGIRDLIEKKVGTPVICPKKAYAIENSKVAQRNLFEKIAPQANPRFKVFDRFDYNSPNAAKNDVYNWLDEIDDEAVVKPDMPALGKGVGVWGDHFTTRESLFDFFMGNLKYGSVIIEEKVPGEESSCMGFCDGKHFMPLPDTRDYKRAFDDDKGPNTGGMGSYKDSGDYLPFLTTADREAEVELANEIFTGWRKKIPDDTALRGVPLYLAFMHTREGIKILEINSRPGDPEIMNLLPIIKDDFVDVCLKMIEGTLTSLATEKLATVLTYKVPPNYGDYSYIYPAKVAKNDVGTCVNLSKAQALTKKYGDRIRIYPGSMEVCEGKNYALKSRTVGVLGIGESIEEARLISQKGANAITGGALWNRTDIATKPHIDKSINNMKMLRRKK